MSSAPPSTTRATGWALVGLLAVAAAWGSSFPLTKVLLGSMSALNFLAVRFVLAAIVMTAVFFPALRRLSRRALVRGLWLGLAYMAVVSGAVAMIVQSWAQAHLAPSRAAIIMSTEPAWAALFSITFLAEPLTWRIALGGALMLGAMLIVETGPGPPMDCPAPEELPEATV